MFSIGESERVGIVFIVIAALVLISAPRSDADSLEDPALNSFISLIDGGSGAGHSGVISINISAGDENVQANSVSVSISDGELAAANNGILQRVGSEANRGLVSTTATEARILSGAFNNSSGLVAINQISGSANEQANSAVIAIGLNNDAVIAEGALQQIYADANVSDESETEGLVEPIASIDENSLRGISGMVQLNQTAGLRNTTGNNIRFRTINHGL